MLRTEINISMHKHGVKVVGWRFIVLTEKSLK
jgi:hypothetical protein